LLNYEINMRKKLILILVPLYLLSFAVQAQEDTIRSLIFTEWKAENSFTAYMELTNVGSDTLDLSKFTLVTGLKGYLLPYRIGDPTIRLSGKLSPGDSYVIMPVYDSPGIDGIPMHETRMIPMADLIVHKLEAGATTFLFDPEKEMWGKDSIDSFEKIITYGGGKRSSGLFYHLDNGDSVLIDAVNNYDVFVAPLSVAGIEGATLTHTLFRKATVKKGNTNWNQARGADAETSEWIPVPHDDDMFATVGNHGNFHIEISSALVIIDKSKSEITVPSDTRKEDLISSLITFGQGVAWQYVDLAFSNQTICQDGDILKVFGIGDTLEEIDFNIIVTPGESSPLTIVESFEIANTVTVDPFGSSNEALEFKIDGVDQPLKVTGAWTVSFDEKMRAPKSIVFNELMSWTQSEVEGIKYYSGAANYTKVVEVSQSMLSLDKNIYLDLGEVANVATVKINEKQIGILWKPPYRLEVKKTLKAGKNTLEVIVSNSWVNRLIGDEQYPSDYEYVKILKATFGGSLGITSIPSWFQNGEPKPGSERILFSTWRHFSKDSPLQEAGLLGPVQLVTSKIIFIPIIN